MSEKHLHYAGIIKFAHENLRQQTELYGAERAWAEHVKNTDRLHEYADAMQNLSCIWDTNFTKNTVAKSRIQWTVDYINSYYFTKKICIEKKKREERQLESWGDYDAANSNYLDSIPDTLNVLDVGSCYNPFREVPLFKVTAVDLCPASEKVLKGDFLNIEVAKDCTDLLIENSEVKSLPANHFNCVIFSLLLEYIPSSELRLQCCRKAYSLLAPEGILIVITPDSDHVGKNASIMKTWRYALGTLGFSRICFEKLAHITCMVFRKSIQPRIGIQWSKEHREAYMSVAIEIPQQIRKRKRENSEHKDS